MCGITSKRWRKPGKPSTNCAPIKLFPYCGETTNLREHLVSEHPDLFTLPKNPKGQTSLNKKLSEDAKKIAVPTSHI